MTTNTYSFIGIGIYTLAEASRLTGVSSPRIRRWIKGYSFKSGEDVHSSPPVWRSQLPLIDQKIALSFLDLIEVRFVDAFLEYGVSWKTIRLAAQRAKEMYQQDHPFVTKDFKTDGRNIFAEVVRDSGEKLLLDLVKSQYAFERVISPSLYKGLEFSEAGDLTRWWPMGKRHSVVIDPQRAFGKPIVSKEGVPTSVLAKAFRIEKSAERVASWYEVSVPSVRAAVQFEEKIAA